MRDFCNTRSDFHMEKNDIWVSLLCRYFMDRMICFVKTEIEGPQRSFLKENVVLFCTEVKVK